jgi:uncharacterized protein (TIGR03435 family)
MRADRKGGPGTSDPGMYACRNCPISWVLSEAYDLLPFEFEAPDWLQTARFDFLANVPPGATKPAFRIMLQNLLADRFKLAVHREKKQMTVYELTVARNGPKFKESLPKDAPKPVEAPGQLQRDRDGFPILPEGTTMAVVPGHARIRSDSQPLSWFVRMLAGQLHGPVIDATGLSAKYDFLLSWSFGEHDAPVTSAAGETPVAPSDPYRPALISAVQSQLGLKLEQKKGHAEVLVVDHIEKLPSAN